VKLKGHGRLLATNNDNLCSNSGVDLLRTVWAASELLAVACGARRLSHGGQFSRSGLKGAIGATGKSLTFFAVDGAENFN
jgi:hypothetical protein